jgi:hypothetical protein
MILRKIEQLTEGAQLGGVPVTAVDSVGLAEDNRTAVVMIELADGRMACFTFCPGSPVVARVVRT